MGPPALLLLLLLLLVMMTVLQLLQCSVSCAMLHSAPVFQVPRRRCVALYCTTLHHTSMKTSMTTLAPHLPRLEMGGRGGWDVRVMWGRWW